VHTIPFEHSTWFPKLFKDYINGNESLKDFYTYEPSLNGLQEAIKNKKFPRDRRGILVEVLLDQYRNVEGFINSQVEKNILALKENATFTITTGQQLHPFLGAEMVFNKIQAIIDSSKGLSGNGKNTVVPVFWMASEDHDFEEVRTIKFFGKDFVWEQEQEGAVGRMPTNSLVLIIQEMINEFSKDEKVVRILSEYKEIYAKHSSYADATREVAFRLFGKHGLVALDADNKKLKGLFKPCLEKEIESNYALTSLGESTAKLNQLGYKTVLNPMGKNLFLLKEQHRVKLSNEEAKEYLDNPESLSPNVVLRPVYQEVILPNLAYFAGPSELSYWLQLKNVFTSLGVDYPVLLPRKFTLGIKKRDFNYIIESNLDFVDLFREEEKLIDLLLEKESEVLQGLLLEKEQLLSKIDVESKKHGASFYKSVKSILIQESKSTSTLKKALKTDLLDQDKINRLLRIKRAYFEIAQERYVFGIEQEINEKDGFDAVGPYFSTNSHNSILVLVK